MASTATPFGFGAAQPTQSGKVFKPADFSSTYGAVDKYFKPELNQLGWGGKVFDNSALMSTGGELGLSSAFSDFAKAKGLNTSLWQGSDQNTLRLLRDDNVLGERTYKTRDGLDKFAETAVPLAISLGTGGVFGQALGLINPMMNPLDPSTWGATASSSGAAPAGFGTMPGQAIPPVTPPSGGLPGFNFTPAGVPASTGGGMDFSTLLGDFGSKLGSKAADIGTNVLTGALLQKLGPKAPKTPDFGQIAQQQADANLGAAQAQNQMNRVDTTTPFGFQKFKTIQDPTVPGGYRYEQEIGLSPEQQELYNVQTQNQLGRGNIASGLQGQVAASVANPLDLNSLGDPTKALDPSAFLGEKEKVTKALYDSMMGLAGPRMQQVRDMLDTRLRNQGLMPGTEAYDRGMKALLDSQAQESQNYVNSAIAGGGAEHSRLNSMQLQNAGLNNQVRGQSLQEMLLKRQQPLAELNSFMTGVTPTLPQFQPFGMGSVAPAPIMQAAQNQYGANADAYNLALQNWQQLLNFGIKLTGNGP